MLRVTDPQLENLMFLRDVTIPWMKRHPERVDLDEFNSKCGTYGCVLGWYSMQRHGRPVYADTSIYAATELTVRDFGKLGVTWHRLFGVHWRGTLDDRARYLDELIAQRLVALEAR